MKEENIDVVFDEKVNEKDFNESDTEIKTYESIQVKYPQEYEDRGMIILEDLNEKETNDCRIQAMFKRSRLNSLSIFIISQDWYELPKNYLS